jgi:hypothetical protein
MNVELSRSGHPALSHVDDLKQEIVRFFEKESAFLAEERQARARALGIDKALTETPRRDLRRA